MNVILLAFPRREFLLQTGYTDHLPVIDRWVIRAVKTKKAGIILSSITHSLGVGNTKAEQ
jgi:hypothetical protein